MTQEQYDELLAKHNALLDRVSEGEEWREAVTPMIDAGNNAAKGLPGVTRALAAHLANHAGAGGVADHEHGGVKR